MASDSISEVTHRKTGFDVAGDEDCACLRSDPSGGPPESAPIACTLEQEALPDRLADWQRVLDRASSRRRIEGGALRLELDGVDLSELARLVEAEQRCCAFFRFAITVDERGVGLEVGAPDGAEDVVTTLFGPPD